MDTANTLKTLERRINRCLNEYLQSLGKLEASCYKETPEMTQARLDYREHIANADKMYFVTTGRIQALMYALSFIQEELEYNERRIKR